MVIPPYTQHDFFFNKVLPLEYAAEIYPRQSFALNIVIKDLFFVTPVIFLKKGSFFYFERRFVAMDM